MQDVIKMEIENTEFDGLKIIRSKKFSDRRGSFLKLHNYEVFSSIGIDCQIQEIYTSVSKKAVVRGLHYQKAPYAHSKIIFCLAGEIFDVALDIRKSSSTYGEYFSMKLSAESCAGLFIPPGFAHGFQSLKDDSIIVNACSIGYAPNCESGVLWDSCGIDWPIQNPILSDKDRAQPPFQTVRG